MDARTDTPLFQPLKIRGATLRNRFVMAPMTREFSPGGVPGDNVADYYARRAAGETGLLITEGVGIDHPAAVDSPDIPLMHGEAALAGWRRVVDRVHAAGGLIFPQLWHQGVLRNTAIARDAQVPGLRPSGLWGTVGVHTFDPDYVADARHPTAPMAENEIADCIAAYARSARNAKEAGFDGIALHGAHGYLIDTFLWRDTNRRTDRFGGDAAGRSRFAVEVVKAIRAAVGPDLPIVFRFSQWKQQDFKARIANSPDDLAQLLTPIAEAGVDVFDASTRYFNTPAFEGSPLNLAGWAKKLTGKMAMTVGGVGLNNGMYDTHRTGSAASDNLDLLLERLHRDEFDLVEVGRAILHDPCWVRKVRTGEPFEAFAKESLKLLT